MLWCEDGVHGEFWAGAHFVPMLLNQRLRIRCRGAVQGVGFRPTVYRLAVELDLAGTVGNDGVGATIEIEGPETIVAGFADRLVATLPPLARLDDVVVEIMALTGATDFRVTASSLEPAQGALVPPDAALCADCRSDMDRSDDRRFRYPFTTCTNCGPRYSLTKALPYDRCRTSMACFPLCASCSAEYDDPADRRYHAEPICCPNCGPRLWLSDRSGQERATGEDAIAAARQGLLDGYIVAIKGLGGFQLACRADDATAVSRLRERKRRPRKPFAIMVRNLITAQATAHFDAGDIELLTSSRGPIVLAPRRADAPVTELVAPGLDDLGLLLPTTALHVELLRDHRLPALVMTSGNTSDEPICCGNREALERLADQADLFLLHDRDILRRVDDSIVRSAHPAPFVVRRSRGWVPEPLALPTAADQPVLSVGGHLQVAGCVARDQQAFFAPHVGDLDSEKARAFLLESLLALEDFLQVEAPVLVADAHPDYPSRWIAEDLVRKRNGRLILVQHHLAHGAAVLAEHGVMPLPGSSALAMIFDGTGWGPDGTSWGGEWLELDGNLHWRRLAHLEPLPLIGGEKAVREPWRVAAAALAQAGATDLLTEIPLSQSTPAEQLQQVASLVNGQWPRASGAGRLFEACGALLGLGAVNGWEGEAAARLEAAAVAAWPIDPWSEVDLENTGGALILPSSQLLTAAARRVVAGEALPEVAAGFHATFCSLAAQITTTVAGDTTGLAAGGGCLVNRLLREGLTRELKSSGIEVLLPTNVPPGDGGLALGQTTLAVVATAGGIDPACLIEPSGS